MTKTRATLGLTDALQGLSRIRLTWKPVTASVSICCVAFVTQAQTASSGPDVTGIRAGMSHTEALAVLRERAPKEQWQTMTVTLQFDDSKQRSVPVPNGSFKGALLNKGQPPMLERYAVYFSPTPGTEHVVAFLREQVFVEQRPLYEDIVKQLQAKYGPPAISASGGTFIWAFNSTGKPMPVQVNKATNGPCVYMGQLPHHPSYAPAWSVGYMPKGTTANPAPAGWAQSCGDVMIRARVQNQGDGFVQSLHVELFAHRLAGEAKVAADALTREAAARELQDARGQAAKAPKAGI